MTKTLLAAWVAAWGVPAERASAAAAQEVEPPRKLTRSVGRRGLEELRGST